MAKLLEKPVVTITITMQLSELELRALLAITEYGDEAFLKVFKVHLGGAADGYESVIKSLFSDVRELAGPILHRANEARKVFKNG